jgi:hypothetical protein
MLNNQNHKENRNIKKLTKNNEKFMGKKTSIGSFMFLFLKKMCYSN